MTTAMLLLLFAFVLAILNMHLPTWCHRSHEKTRLDTNECETEWHKLGVELLWPKPNPQRMVTAEKRTAMAPNKSDSFGRGDDNWVSSQRRDFFDVSHLENYILIEAFYSLTWCCRQCTTCCGHNKMYLVLNKQVLHVEYY